MSTTHPSSPPPAVDAPWVRPRWFVAGFALMLGALSLLGWKMGRTDYHDGFIRFHPLISPENFYYPTVAEMCSIVRARCRPDQVLVIVGGNSINYGAGQPPGKIWTEVLQRQLGDRYCVVNFASRGATVTDMGAVIAEVFRKEFPRQIYVANTGPVQAADPMGHASYRFLFWDAYYKGLLENSPARTAWVESYEQRRGRGDPPAANRWSDRADQVLHFRDLWNWVAWDLVFTVSAPMNPDFHQLLRPKKSFKDVEGDLDSVPWRTRYRLEAEKDEMAITRAFFQVTGELKPDGSWGVKEHFRKEFLRFAEMAIPDPLKPRTLIILSQNSPYYLEKLTAEERARNDALYQAAGALWREAGYAAMTYGPGMTARDFVDRTHLAGTGGAKLAGMVAPEIESLAQRLGYFSAPKHP